MTPTGLEAEPRTDRRIVLDTHVADVGCLVYLDAFLPADGDSSWSLTNDDERDWFIADARGRG